jgi:hypothetical protein
VILEPGSISARVEEVMVQMSPAWPVKVEHSFSTWKVPLRVAAAADKPSDASCGGAVESEQAPRTTVTTMAEARASVRLIIGCLRNEVEGVDWYRVGFACSRYGG